MMQRLAEWSMQSRWQASIAIAIAFAIPLLFWIGSALAALVFLRQGISEGMKVVLWGSLPAVGWLAAGDPTAVVTLVPTLLAAFFLRASNQLGNSLCLLGGLGVIGYVLVPTLYGDAFPIMVEQGKELLSASFKSEPEALEKLEPLLQPAMQGGLSALHTVISILCLLLGRFWQSTLDHPGGFGVEFRRLRLPLAFSVPTVIGTLGVGAIQPEFACTLLAATIPLCFAGLAIIHGVVHKTNAGSQWLVFAYAACIFVGAYMYTLLIFVALLDGFIDIRARLKDTV